MAPETSGPRGTLRDMARRAPRGFVYLMARRLETYSFAAAPEQLAVMEGLRAAVVVVSPVALSLWLGRPMLSWAAFGAFWTCLADPGGSDRRRLACMAGFAVAGSIAAFTGAATGAAGPISAGGALLVLTFLAGLSGTYGPAAAQVGTLAAVVAVVAVAFPQPTQGAAILSGTFLLGTLWALVLCTGIWRIHPHASARRALGAVYLRLGDMLGTLLALDRQSATVWAHIEAEHRRAVRGAIERARMVVLDFSNGIARYGGELETADRVFAALVAAEHDRATRETALATIERSLLYRLQSLLAETRHQTAQHTPQPGVLAAEATALCQAAGSLDTVTGRTVAVAAQALADQAHAWAGDPPTAAPEGEPRTSSALFRPVPAIVLHHAVRLAVAVAVSYAITAALGLNFSYWATISTVVVVQPGLGATWPRSLERMLGSTAGGLLAALLVLIAPTPLALLPTIFPIATAAIALRRVNYTLFVIAVTCLFVLVTELLLPAKGIPVTRAINSVIGSLVGLAAALFLWPERVADNLAKQLADAVAANFTLAAHALASENPDNAFDSARRAAGMTSTAAETTCHRLALAGQSHRLHLREAACLLTRLRILAGAAVAQALSERTPDTARAALIEQLAIGWAAALRDPSAARSPQMPADRWNEEMSEALGGVTSAISEYVAACRPRYRNLAARADQTPAQERVT